MGVYDERPWRWLYQPGVPTENVPEHSDMLSAWRAGAGGMGNGYKPLCYYFDTPVKAVEIDGDSDALAAALTGLGLRRGDRIALYLQNMPQFIVGLLAAWKLGATVVPVNPMLKERELRYVLKDSGAKAIISLQDLWNSVAAKGVEGTEVTLAIATSALDYLDHQPPPLLAGVSRMA